MSGGKRVVLSGLSGIAAVVLMYGFFKLGTLAPDWLAPLIFACLIFGLAAYAAHEALGD